MPSDLSSRAHQGTAADGEPRQHESGLPLASEPRSDVTSVVQRENSKVPSPTGTNGNWRRRLIFAFALIALIAVSIWLIFLSIAPSDSVPRLTHTIKRGELVVSVIENGTLESSNNTEIKCNVRGYSTVTWVIPGGTVVEPGDVLVELDTKKLEDEIGKHTTDAHIAKATFERTKADVENAEVAIEAYLKGTYQTQLDALEKRLDIAEENLANTQEILTDSQSMFRRGFVTRLEVEAFQFNVRQAKLELKVRQTAIDMLNKYTKEMQLETLRGNLRSLRSKFKADEAGLRMDEGRRDRAIQELEYCVIRADRRGLVIYPSAAEWKSTPDIAEGARVRKDQVLLLMPELSQMQVKVSIHESIIDGIKKDMVARVRLPELKVDGQVVLVASVAKPAGWWTGNAVKYDTVIDLPAAEGLKPGMSAEVEVIIERYKDVLTVPVSAVVETEDQNLCWVQTSNGVQRRVLQLGNSNDVFIVVESGLQEGDEVVLNPLQLLEEAQGEARLMQLQTADPWGDSETNDRVQVEARRTEEASNVN